MSTIAELNDAIGGRLCRGDALGDLLDAPLGPVQSDSRKIEPGDVFWALRGPNHEGEHSSARRFDAGRPAPWSPSNVSVPDGHWVIRVDDTHQALLDLGAVEAAAVHRHGDRRDRQRRQDHRAADDPHRAAIAASRHGQPAKLQQPLRRAAEHDGHRAGPRLRRAGVGREPAGRDRRAGRVVGAEGRRDHLRGRRPSRRLRQPAADRRGQGRTARPPCRPTAGPCWATIPGCETWPQAVPPPITWVGAGESCDLRADRRPQRARPIDVPRATIASSACRSGDAIT